MFVVITIGVYSFETKAQSNKTVFKSKILGYAYVTETEEHGKYRFHDSEIEVQHFKSGKDTIEFLSLPNGDVIKDDGSSLFLFTKTKYGKGAIYSFMIWEVFITFEIISDGVSHSSYEKGVKSYLIERK